MDKILEGILRSSHPERLKEKLIDQVVVSSAAKPLDRKIYLNLLKMSFDLAIHSHSEFDRNIGMKVYLKYAESNQSSAAEFWSGVCLSDVLNDQMVMNKIHMVQIIDKTLKSIRNHSVYDQSIEAFKESLPKILTECTDNLQTTKAVIVLLKDLTIHPSWNRNEDFFKLLLKAIGQFYPASQDATCLSTFISDITTICSLLKQIWFSGEELLLKNCLLIIYNILCLDEEPSLALAAVAQVYPVKNLHLTNVLMEEGVLVLNDKQLTNVLEQIINWLNWPISTNIHFWILYLLQELAKAKKYKILMQVGRSKIEQIADRLFIAVGRNGAFQVLSYLLLSTQHTPELFHKVLHRLNQFPVIFKTDQSLMESFTELVQCMFYLHSGFPELYDPLLKSISEFSTPTPQRIRKILADHKLDLKKTRTYSERDGSSMNVARRGRTRNPDGYVGLENLGNICYMNSIVQVLFMTNDFASAVMKSQSTESSCFGALQYLFAFLIHSKRMSVAPSSFLKASKPPWFENGCQQDCSEFLRYLLDVLHEQLKMSLLAVATLPAHDSDQICPSAMFVENCVALMENLHSYKQKSDKGMVENTFFGRIETSYKCENCKTISRKCDDLVDIGLTFTEEQNLQNGLTSRYKTRHNASDGKSKDLRLEELLDQFLLPETLEGENRYSCETCASLQDATRTVKIAKAPKHLIMHLLRFSYNLKNHSRSKICIDVKYPKTLKVPSVSGDDKVFNVYALYGVVVHSGLTLDCGHYYSYARRLDRRLSQDVDLGNLKADTDLYGDQWFLFNDSNVSLSSYESFGNVTQRFPTDTAYMLFYRLVDSNQVEATDLKGIQMTSSMTQVVLQDNQAVLQEEEEKESEKKRSKNSLFTRNLPSWHDFDEDGNSPQGGSSCGLGNLDLSVSRFVF